MIQPANSRINGIFLLPSALERITDAVFRLLSEEYTLDNTTTMVIPHRMAVPINTSINPSHPSA